MRLYEFWRINRKSRIQKITFELKEGIISLSTMLNKGSKRNVCWTIQDEQYQFQMFYLDE